MLTLAIILEGLTGLTPDQIIETVSSNQLVAAKVAEALRRSINGGVIDSRQDCSGSLFVALPGENVDGHDYVNDAFRHGAALALVQREPSQPQFVVDLRQPLVPEKIAASLAFLEPRAPLNLLVKDSLLALQGIAGFWRSRLAVKVIGITGSVGKSTTKEIVADVLGQRFRVLKSPGNLNNEIGLPLSLLRLTEEHERAVLEMGFYVPGEIALLCKLAQPHIGVITNIGTVHAERAGSQEAIAQGKAELVQSLPSAPQGVAILNYDDPWVLGMAEKTQAKVFFYGLSPQAHLWADGIEGLGLEGIRFRLHYRHETLHLRAPLIGRHSVHTALRAAAVGLVEGLTWQEIVAGLHSERTQLRLVSVRSDVGALILDDTYNASPESTLAALNLLDELSGRKIAVLGDMLELGPYEQEGHEAVGARAADVVDELITVGERGRLIANAAWQAGLSKKVISVCSDNQQVIDYLRNRLRVDDVVLVKGSRGMRMDLIVAALEAKR
jgi:UDP-N-acetylmuramoyl-tripeptide--D-alanyl-D-alanine ligase